MPTVVVPYDPNVDYAEATPEELASFIRENDTLIVQAIENFQGTVAGGGGVTAETVLARARAVHAQVAAGLPTDETGLRTLIGEQESVLASMSDVLGSR
jgi:hypothetical protein